MVPLLVLAPPVSILLLVSFSVSLPLIIYSGHRHLRRRSRPRSGSTDTTAATTTAATAAPENVHPHILQRRQTTPSHLSNSSEKKTSQTQSSSSPYQDRINDLPTTATATATATTKTNKQAITRPSFTRRFTDGSFPSIFTSIDRVVDTPGSAWSEDEYMIGNENTINYNGSGARDGDEEGNMSDGSQESYVRFGRGMTMMESKVGGGVVVSEFEGGSDNEEWKDSKVKKEAKAKGDRYNPASERNGGRR